MATLDDILYKAKTMAQTAGEKTGEWIEVAKLRIDATQKEKEITASLEGLGRLVYDARKSGEDVEELLTACVERVDELTVEAEALRERINRYKGLIPCPACGVTNPEDASYCKKCGAQLG